MGFAVVMLTFIFIFLTGQLKGKQRQQALEAIADGSAGIIIGTHALFQDAVEFARLGLNDWNSTRWQFINY
jgi:RecG-like helicase